MITLYMSFLSLYKNNLNNWDYSWCLQYCTESDWLSWCLEVARDMTSFVQFSLTFEVLRDKAALGFYCRTQEVMWFQSLHDFYPYQLPLAQPNKHPLCLPGTSRSNCRKNKALVSPPVPERSKIRFVLWLTNTEPVLNILVFVSIFFANLLLL